MGDIYDETVGLIESLGELTPHGRALAEVAKALAMDADNPFVDPLDGKQASRSANVNSLRATLTELVEKGRIRGSNEGEGVDDWASAASAAGATPIRDIPEPGAGDARPGGRKGRSATR